MEPITTHTRTYKFKTDSGAHDGRTVIVSDHPEGLMLYGGISGDITSKQDHLLTWLDLFKLLINTNNVHGAFTTENMVVPRTSIHMEVPRTAVAPDPYLAYTCRNCGWIYGEKLPFPESDPLCACDMQESVGMKTPLGGGNAGLVARMGSHSIDVWLWAYVTSGKLLGHKWFFSEDQAEQAISELDGETILHHTLEKVTVPLNQGSTVDPKRQIVTRDDVAALVSLWYEDSREELLIKMLVAPQ